jgi:hypothetical protein
MSALEYLAPVIAVCATIGFGCLAAAGYNQWKRWPDPRSWQSKYGTVRRRK